MSLKPRKPTKRTLQAQRTKEKLYTTSLALFSKYSFDKVTISDITEACGVSSGTFYVYYESKDAIILELFSRIDIRYEDTMAGLPDDISCSDAVRRLLGTVWDYISNEIGCQMMQIIYTNQVCAAKRSVHLFDDHDRFLHRTLRELHSKGVASGEFKDVFSDDRFAEMILRAVHGTVFDWCVKDGAFDLSAEGSIFINYLLSEFSN